MADEIENTKKESPWSKRECLDANAKLTQQFTLFMQDHMNKKTSSEADQTDKIQIISEMAQRFQQELLNAAGMEGQVVVMQVIPDTFSIKVRAVRNTIGEPTFNITIETPNHKPIPSTTMTTILEDLLANLRSTIVKSSIHEDNRQKLEHLMTERKQDIASDSQI